MDSKQKTPQSPVKAKRRPRSKDENQDEDVDIPDRAEADSRRIAQPSPRRMSNTRSASEDEDVDMDLPERESTPVPEANEDVDMESRARESTPTPEVRDSMSPARKAKTPPLVPVTTLPPGTQLFATPSLFTGTHAVKDSAGGFKFELPLRDDSSQPGHGTLANGNVNGSSDTQLHAPPSSPRPRNASVSATQRQSTKFDYQSFLHFATEMLLSKQDSGAMGFDWSLSDFQQQYNYVHNVPGPPSAYTFSPDQKLQLAEMVRRKKAGAQGFDPSPPTLGYNVTALITGLPSTAALPDVVDDEKSHSSPSVESGSQDDSFDADLERAIEMSLEKEDEQQPDVAFSPPSPREYHPSKLRRSPRLSMQNSARPSSPPLGSGSRFTSINGRASPALLLDGSAVDQPVQPIESDSRRGINSYGPTPAKRPTRSAARRAERIGERAEDRSDSATENTQRVTIHPIYECCCPHCGFAGESYTKFKRHLAEHFVKDGWTEYRCPVKGCDEVFAKSELTQYMKYLEVQGLIQPKDRGIKDSLAHVYGRFKYELNIQKSMREKEEALAMHTSKIWKARFQLEEVERQMTELDSDEDDTEEEEEEEEVVIAHADDDSEDHEYDDDATTVGVTF